MAVNVIGRRASRLSGAESNGYRGAMHVATLCGSHHHGSTNAVVLATISARLITGGATVESVDVSVDAPSLRPESLDDPPPVIGRIRDTFLAADGVVFSIPEYAGGPPGWVKNITDWMVSAAALYERPVVVVSAATTGGPNAIEQMATTLAWQGAYVVATCGIAAPLTMVRDDHLTDPDAIARLDDVADVLLAVMRGDRDVTDATAEALTPLGIDPFDRTT
jgi:NAD(P)H-dependent FMN reductase